MPWFKVDDKLPSHRKVLSIRRGSRRLQAIGAWTLCGAWVSGNDHTGFISDDVIEEQAVPKKVCDELVAARMWHRVEGGYRMHDFNDYNPNDVQVAAEKAAAAERQRRAREKAKAKRDAERAGEEAGVTA